MTADVKAEEARFRNGIRRSSDLVADGRQFADGSASVILAFISTNLFRQNVSEEGVFAPRQYRTN
jgi:hypothetical protein